jgi:hypothetical protein
VLPQRGDDAVALALEVGEVDRELVDLADRVLAERAAEISS